jgi:predicted amidophosphoribosyltransferase
MRCLYCPDDSQPGRVFCAACWRAWALELVPRGNIAVSFPNSLAVQCAGYYTGRMARLVQVIKSQPFNYLPQYLFRPLEELLDHWAAELAELPIDAIAHVPSHLLRGALETDLSTLLASTLARRLQIEHCKDLLHKRWSFRQQKQQKSRERWRRSAGLYTALGGRPRRLLLVDDVSTSGASLFYASRALQAAGHQCAYGFVLASAMSLSYARPQHGRGI